MKALPFPCIRPVPEHVAEVAAPPYDAFDRTEAAAYVQGRPLSFLNIDRPETQFAPSQDMHAPAVYMRGEELLDEQILSGLYIEDRRRAYYIYELSWEGRTQTGIAAVCPADEYENATIKGHELTHEDKERDRAEHIKALGCQTGPILLAYRDQPVLDMIMEAAKLSTPLYAFTDDRGVRQTVWEIVRRDAVDALRMMLEQIPCAYIADGHHRAAAAVRVARAARAEARETGSYTGKEPFNYVLSVLFPASQLIILPYNRVVIDRKGLAASQLIDAVRAAGFDAAPSRDPIEPASAGTMGMLVDGSWWMLSMSSRLAREVSGGNLSASLDTSVLQDRILGPILGIDGPCGDRGVEYVGGIYGVAEVERRTGARGVGFTLCAADIGQMLAVADAGLLMPPKSTWFEPKLSSGIFIHRIAR